ncbi:MAG: excinuclease ABC subunit UvrA [Bacilli bacterium]|nr:excinuclease ABC subunit UvrA [Bacilli bacterium]
MLPDKIVIKGARENNLKNIDLVLPHNKLIVMTGLSGSGKSTLAFDTIYAEGQRRYVESLSAYARQFLGGVEKPDVDSIEGLSPAIAIDQKNTSNNPRSTVGTVTEIYDYLRLLYARIGIPYCPTHNIPIQAQTLKQMVERVYELEEGSKIVILAPVSRMKKGTHKEILDRFLKEGFIRVRIDNEYKMIEEIGELDKNKKHNIDIVIDRLILNDAAKARISDSIETALTWGKGLSIIESKGKEILLSSNYSCPHCGFSVGKLEPNLFSFNSPIGACKGCNGLGVNKEVDIDLLIPNKDLSLNKGAILYYKNIVGSENIEWQEFEILCQNYNIDMDMPYKHLSEYEKKIILFGSDKPIKYSIETRSGNKMNRNTYIEGVKTHIERLYASTTSEMMRSWYGGYLNDKTCPVCGGKRLNEQALCVRVGDKNIYEVTSMSIKDIIDYFEKIDLTVSQKEIANLILKEIKERLGFLINVGLDYLTLARSSGSLSGGESQRIRLATQIGSHLVGVLYVLDEPSIGLHQRDNQKLIDTLKSMRDLGNTLIVVEHDEETMLAADYIVDVGPGSGIHGGEIVAAGTPQEVMDNENSITGRYLSKKESIAVPQKRRKGNGQFVDIIKASGNNLKNINVKIPLGCLVVVTGVSGSGKSTLVNEILGNSLINYFGNTKVKPLAHEKIIGMDNIDKLIDVSQDPIGRTPRSNPATYTGVFDFIRDLFASTKEARMRGYDKGRFSFNVKGGRCERCQGDGVIRVPMNFLPDVYVTCEDCGGKRYNDETLAVTYKGKNIFQILDMTVENACEFFKNIPNIKRRIETLNDVGLGYIKLGQSATTLSGGEAQRLKLAFELQRKSTGKTLYILDEPTTGLHSDDVKRLLFVLNKIVDNGDSMIIIEHNLDIIKCADYIIDLGPEGGEGGGNVVTTGTPEEVAKCKSSYTGYYLNKVLK